MDIRIGDWGLGIGIRYLELGFWIRIENWNGDLIDWAIFEILVSPTFHMQLFWWLRYSKKTVVRYTNTQ